MSAASLQLRHGCDAATEEQVDESLPLIAEYYGIRIRQIAATARHYFLALSLGERMLATDNSIATQIMIKRHFQRNEASEHHDAHSEVLPHRGLADLHAHRIRLRAQYDAALIVLSQLTAQPLYLLAERMTACTLPAGSADMPAIGQPFELQHRRTDLLIIQHHVEKMVREDDVNALRSAQLAYEQRSDLAVKEVELALVALDSVKAEWIPVHASAVSAETYCQRLRRAAPTSAIDDQQWSDAETLSHAYRDREIETRARSYLALVDLFHALGGGWPAISKMEASA